KTKTAAEQAKPRTEKEPGVPVSTMVLSGVIVGVLFLCCGGIGLVWWVASSAAPTTKQNPPNNPPNNPPPNNPPGKNAGKRAEGETPPDFAGAGGVPGLPPGPPPIADVKGALGALAEFDSERRKAGADWLARNPRDEAQAAAVAKALDPLL